MAIHLEYPPIDLEVFRQGRTSAAGNVGGTTFIDTALAGVDIPVGTIVVLYTDNSGSIAYRGVFAFDAVSTVTLATAMPAQIPAGTAYALIVSSTGLGMLSSGVVATGTFTTSSATVPADTSKTEGNNYWDGCLIVPLSGACAFQVRRIETFTNAGGVFTIDPKKTFTAAVGLVPYVILASMGEYKAPTNASANITLADVIGAKDDTAGFTPGNIRSVMYYIKGLVTYLNGVETKGETGASNIGGGAVNIITIAADGNRKELNGVFLSMTGSGASVTAGATVTIRVYRAINGVERQVDQFTVLKGTDPDVIPIVNSWVPIENNSLGAVTAFRVSMQSSNAGDNAVLVPYSYTTRAMQF